MKTDYEKFKILGTISALLRQLEEPSAKPELDMFGEPIASPNKTLDVTRVDVKDIKVDPKAYQFRSEVGHDGTDKRLNEVKAWDDLRAGVMVIHERHDGQQFIADGHHRIALAKKLGVDGVNAFVLKESEGHTVDDAKSLAALVNLANNNGTGVDAAKLFRSNANGKRPEQLMEDLNLPKNQAIKTGVALAKLSDDVFGSVVNGVIEERDGAVIGDTFSSPEEQQAALKQFMRVRPANQEESQVLAQQIKLAGFSKAQASDNFDLFGSELDTDSLLGERTRLIVALGRAYKKDKTLFETLGINASKIEQAGNKLDKDTNSKLSNEATVMQSLLGEQIYTNPKMKQVLDQYATELKDNPNGMAAILAKLKQALPQVVQNTKAVFDSASDLLTDAQCFQLLSEAMVLVGSLPNLADEEKQQAKQRVQDILVLLGEDGVELLPLKVQSEVMKDNMFKQPPAETFSVYDPSVPKVIPDTSTPLKAAVILLEDGIRQDDMENGIIFDENGDILLKKRGLPDRLEFTDEELSLLRGRVFTHNHPNGTAFSRRDIIMAIDHNIGELRAVTAQLRFSLRPQKGRQWPSRLAFNGYHEKAIAQANILVDDMVKTGALHYSHVKFEHRHYTWVLLALYLDLVYGREKS